MMKKIVRGAVVAGATALLLVACATDSSNVADKGTALIGLQRDEPLHVGEETITRVDADGRESLFTFKADTGKLLAVYFGFTNCPDLCPTTLADLRSAFRRVEGSADRVDVAMVTVDPDRDTPKVLVPYLTSFIADPIALRTTNDSQLKRVEAAFLASATVKKEATGKVSVSHTAATYVVDEAGDVIVEWPFGIGADGMENDLKILLADLPNE